MQPLSFNSEASYNADETGFQQVAKGDEQQHEFFSPWNQPSQPAQISMHSTSNSFYDDGPPKPVSIASIRARSRLGNGFRVGGTYVRPDSHARCAARSLRHDSPTFNKSLFLYEEFSLYLCCLFLSAFPTGGR